VIAEVLFDVAQAMPLAYQTKSDKPFSMELVLIDVEQAIAEIQSLWQAWQNPLLVNYSPNKAPIIKQPEQLRKRRSADVYQTLTKLLDGQHTLRDVAVETKRDVVAVTRSLLPCIQLGWVELTTIPDLSIPLPTPVQRGVPETPPARTAPTGPLVACVDDSPLVCRTMEGLLTAAGYRFVAVNDALRAIATLLARKPDVIFLDLVMPNANGYEICEQLRKISCFRNTPIVILTGNDGFVDRFRAKVVGASDFLSKPVDAELVLSVVHKHLEQGAISH
jgi:chemotaxis family two-component system response regulator PixG